MENISNSTFIYSHHPLSRHRTGPRKNSANNNIGIGGASEMGREDLDRMEIPENPVENEEIDLETGCKISPGVFVEVIKGNFVGYSASVLEKVEMITKSNISNKGKVSSMETTGVSRICK